MILFTPVEIAPNLEPGVRVGEGWVTIGYAGHTDEDGRTQYRCTILMAGEPQYVDYSLHSGCQGGSLREGLSSFLSFLGAAAESYRSKLGGLRSEDEALFPEHIVDWAYMHSDELSVMQLWVEENPGCIAE